MLVGVLLLKVAAAAVPTAEQTEGCVASVHDVALATKRPKVLPARRNIVETPCEFYCLLCTPAEYWVSPRRAMDVTI